MNYIEAIKSTPVVLVEFYASWCPHCQRMMPVVAQVKEALAGKVEVYQYDIDKNQELATSERVETIPTFIVYKDGNEVWRHSGEIDGHLLLAKVEESL